MHLEHRQRALRLLNEALELAAADRSAFLEASCGNDANLRHELEALVEFAEKDNDFMERPAFSVHARAPDAGRRIGPYKLVRLLGRGGMGAVYLAVRKDDFEKRVALKVIKRGMDTDEIVRRFQNERRILAGLEHPYIARLLDGGTTSEGLPWFAMDYIEGEPIHSYCDARRLSIRQRIELFRKVCSAVYFAHQNLVVHRDLKPANILITTDGVPRLLDFGIAKLLEPEALSEPLLTRPACRPMTPEFASPEQIRGESVTTAADTYSLGVLLYRLLSGHSPYGPKGLPEKELHRRICEKESPKPSAAVRKRTEPPPWDRTGSRLSPNSEGRIRNGDPRKLRRRLAGDLDAIVLMALCKDPRHRYGSVEQFSEDLRRHLSGRPVIARNRTFPYRTGKFLKRNRWSLAALMVIVAFALSVTVLWQRALRGEDEAVRRQREAEEVTDFLVDLFRASTPNRAKGKAVMARELLDRGRDRIHTLENAPEIYATLTSILGRIYGDLGHYEDARALLESSLEVRREIDLQDSLPLADALHYLAQALHDLDHDRAALPLVREALEIRRKKLDERNSDVLKTMSDLAALTGSRGDYEEAAAIYQRVLKIRRALHGTKHWRVAKSLHNLGTMFYHQGAYEKAEPALREALEIRRAVRHAEHTEVADTLNNLAMVLQARGKREEAEAFFHEALGIQRKISGERHVHTARIERNLAWLLTLQGNSEEALKLARHALDIFRGALPQDHWRIADAKSVLGGCLTELRRFDEAENLLRGSYGALGKIKGEDSVYTRQARLRIRRFSETRKLFR